MEMRTMNSLFAFLLGILPIVLLGATGAGAAQVTIGAVEEVVLMPWRAKLPARIDTGAAKSSLAARNLRIRGNVAEFRLPSKYGGLRMRLPVIEWRHIRTNVGVERRPVVEMDLCLAHMRLRTKVNLDDRIGLHYPFLVGRNTLEGNFLVDVKRSHTAPPICGEMEQ